MTAHDPRLPTEHDRRIGERIRILRQDKAMSQTILGEACGVTFQQMQKYEEGRNRIANGRLVQIAKALEVSVGYLLDGLDRPAKATTTIIERMLAEHMGHKLAAAFLSIDDHKVKVSIANFVESYAQALARRQAFGPKKRGRR
ncbi:MAG TPA: helix-turn-helix transcriptional regulator [Candidatus Acidoferrum sp.]